MRTIGLLWDPFFCVFQPRMVALLSVPATQGPPEEMDVELHKLHIATFPLRVNPKGQLISECIYEVIVSPKIRMKNCQDFCPV